MVRVLPNHFGVVLGCKGDGGKKQVPIFFEAQSFETELQARYSTMLGFESLFWRGTKLQRRRGEEKIVQVPKSFFNSGPEKGHHRQDKTRQTKHKPRAASEVKQPLVSPVSVRLRLLCSYLLAVLGFEPMWPWRFACFWRACFLLSYINNHCLLY